MTTNIFDRKIPKLASDSRWSIDSKKIFGEGTHEHFVLYVDDTGCDKIEFSSLLEAAFIFAGNGQLIQSWKDWLSRDPINTQRPATDGKIDFAICVVDATDGQILHESRQAHALPDARFTGTGGIHAYKCWMSNRDPCLAIRSAIELDTYSGGEVTFFNLSNSENNLKNSASMSDVMSLFPTEGCVMYLKNQNSPIPVQQAASNDGNVKAVLTNIASGIVAPCAPFDGMNVPWTKEENIALDEAIAKLVSRAKK